jgi:hypothetical protein
MIGYALRLIACCCRAAVSVGRVPFGAGLPGTLLILLCVKVVAAGLTGADAINRYKINHWTSENGLPANKITAAGVSTLAGLPGVTGNKDGLGSEARFDGLVSVAMDPFGNLFVADPGNQTIRHVSLSGLVTTVAGLPQNAGSVNGTGSDARLNDPRRIAPDRAGNVYVSGNNQTIRKGWPAWSEMPPVLTASLQAGDNVIIRLNIPVGVRVLVEASVDLNQWEMITDGTAIESVMIIDEGPVAGHSAGFYRARYFLP